MTYTFAILSQQPDNLTNTIKRQCFRNWYDPNKVSKIGTVDICFENEDEMFHCSPYLYLLRKGAQSMVCKER